MTARQIAQVFNIACSTVALWRRQGMPCKPRRRAADKKSTRYDYDVQQIRDWFQTRSSVLRQSRAIRRNTVMVTLDEGASLPKKAHDSDVGYDVTSVGYTLRDSSNNTIDPADEDSFRYIYTVVVDTGVHIKPPRGYYFELVPNSRIAKTPFIMCNSPGIIDPDYRGSVKACFRVGQGASVASLDYFAPGKVVAQLILRKQEFIPLVQVSKLNGTARGNGGFGSTEKH